MQKKILIPLVITTLSVAAAFFAYKYYTLLKDSDSMEDNYIADQETAEIQKRTEKEIVPIKWNDISWEGPDYSDREVQNYICDYIDENTNESKTCLDLLHILSFLEIANPPWAYRNSTLIEDTKENFINKIFCLIAGDNNRLLKTYKRFRSVIYETIDQEMFDELNVGKFLNSLYLSYNAFCDDATLNHEPDYMLLENMYKDLLDISYSDNAKIMELISKYEIPCYMSEDDDLLFWAYSFWPRRYHERNYITAKIILDDLRTHYVTFDQNDKNDNKSYTMYIDEKIPTDENGNFLFHREINNEIHNYRFDSFYRRTGKWESIYPKYKYHMLCDMEKDVNHGFFEFYEKGFLMEKYPYKNGRKEGTSFYKEYGVEKHANWENGELNGELIEKVSNGETILKTAYYMDGVLHGEYKEYYINGNLKEQSLYNHGELIESRLYDTEGDEL